MRYSQSLDLLFFVILLVVCVLVRMRSNKGEPAVGEEVDGDLPVASLRPHFASHRHEGSDGDGETGAPASLHDIFRDSSYSDRHTRPDVDGYCYQPPAWGWTCFHCGEHFPNTFIGQREARLHFGPDPGFEPGCVTIAKNRRYDLFKRLRFAQIDNAELRTSIERLEEQVESIQGREADLARRFKDPSIRTDNDVWNAYHSMEGRALAAELFQKVLTDHALAGTLHFEPRKDIKGGVLAKIEVNDPVRGLRAQFWNARSWSDLMLMMLQDSGRKNHS